MTPHPYADILRAIADGHEIEYSADSQSRWVGRSHKNVLKMLSFEHSAVPAPEQFRIKPRTIRIGEFDVPEPLRVAPDYGSYYWSPNPWLESGVDQILWDDDDQDVRALSAGWCHSTYEAAEQHARALFSLTAPRP